MKERLTGYLSVRSLPPDLERKITGTARQRQTTKSRVVIEALRQAFGLGAKPKRKADIHKLFGRMHPDDIKAVEEAVQTNRPIEPKLWQ